MTRSGEAELASALGVAEDVVQVIDEFLGRKSLLLGRIDSRCRDLAEAARRATRGGKRLRPAFCYWAYRACGGEHSREVLSVGASLELLHSAALVHDDIIDDASTRRGEPSAFRRFEQLAETWRPSAPPEDFGRAAAILLGDLLLVWADELVSALEVEPAVMQPLRSYFDIMRTEVIGGAYLELASQASAETDLDTAMTILQFKSAKYTVERPVQIGAVLAQADPARLASLTDFGRAAGEAFQLRDDLLGTFGDAVVVGKPVGEDLRDGRCPPLLALARNASGRAAVKEIDCLRAQPSPKNEQRARLVELIVESGAESVCERMITERLDRARTSLRHVPLADDSAVAMLEALAVAGAYRSS